MIARAAPHAPCTRTSGDGAPSRASSPLNLFPAATSSLWHDPERGVTGWREVREALSSSRQLLSSAGARR